MALTWVDDFKSYGTVESYLLNGLYAEYTSVSLVTDPETGSGNVLRFDANPYGGGGATGLIRKVLDTSNTTAGMACRIYLASLPPASDQRPMPIVFCDASNNRLITVHVTPSGQLQAYYNNLGTLLGTSAANSVVAGSWIHIECKVFMSATVGTLEIRVEGVPVLTLTGLALSGTAIAMIRPINDPDVTSAAPAYYMKDLVVWDGSGAYNNDFLGSVSVEALVPDSDVSFNWTPSTGTTGYDLIDEAPPNDDTDYIQAADTLPSPSTFGLSDLPANVSSVKGLMSLVRASKVDAGDGNIQVSMVSGASADAGADTPVGASYTYYYDFFETDPNTGVAWLPAAVDAAQFKLDRTL